MQPDFQDFLTYDIKKEIADRYFGFRKMIEDDKLSLSNKIKLHSMVLEKRICFDLVRIYILLNDEKLIKAFAELTGCGETYYYDSYLTESATIRHRVFKGLEVRGITRSGRFNNLIFDCYDRLTQHVVLYREKLEELKEEHETIRAEIELFYKKNDLTSIMGFLRSLQAPVDSLQMIDPGFTDAMERRMHIAEPPPVEKFLPAIPLLPPLASVKKQLKGLIDRAYKQHTSIFLTEIIR